MHKKHIFLRVFQKITIFACVFCAFSAWSDTTTCDIDFTPVTGNSWQNGTPTPTNPVAIESIGTKIGNKYQIPVVAQGKNLCPYQISDWKTHTTQTSGYWNYIVSNLLPSTKYTLSIYSTQTCPQAVIRLTGSSSPYKVIQEGITSVTTDSNADGTITIGMDNYIWAGGYSRYLSNIQLEQGSVATSYAPYGHSTTPIYLNAPLRKVGNYADVLDYKNGTITRNVGVKVLDGTESWSGTTVRFSLDIADMMGTGSGWAIFCSHYKGYLSSSPITDMPDLSCKANRANLLLKDAKFNGDVTDFKSYLAQQYANGTPVTIYYPLATPVVEQIENWSCPVPITDIKIATTKMVDEEFAQAEA
ncbi:MAG: hypothetical protein KBT14_02975, partial [Proteobacteria bacterium]|nr:hypothetical protein [Candidatus Enterousia onthequi]